MTRRERRALAALEAAFEQAAARLAAQVTQAVTDRAVVLVAAGGEAVQFNPDDAYRIEWWVRLVDQLIDPALHDAALAAMQAAATRMGVAFDLVSPFLEQAVVEQLEGIASFAESHRTFITEHVQAGMREGLSVEDLVRRLIDPGDSPLNRAQARRVAQTEMIGAQNAANIATYQASGLTGTVRWAATHDEHTRAEHLAVDGQERRVGEPFDVAGHPARWPADPRLPAHLRINCRCRVTFEPDLVQPQAEQVTVQFASGGVFTGPPVMIGEPGGCVAPPRVVARVFFDSSQPREKDGKWGKDGGGGPAGQGPAQEPPAAASRVIADETEAKAFLGRYDGWKKDLTDGEDRAMRFYQSPGYALMNGELRGGKGSVDAPEADLKRARQATKDLKTAIGKAPPLDEPLTVWRGMSADHFDGPIEPGQTVSDKGFTSTALYRKGVASVAEKGAQVTAEIRLPAGTKAAAGSARELVLPPDAQFRVVSKKGRNVVLEYQPPAVKASAVHVTPQAVTVQFYSPAQPRDRKGRWGAGGAGSGHANPGATRPGGVENDYATHLGKVQAVYNNNSKYEAMQARYGTTRTHKDRNGNWTAERQAQQQRILDEFDQKHRNVPNNGEVIVTGGLGGAGKTTILKQQADRLGITFAGDDATSHATVNPDDFKDMMFKHGMIPDVPGMTPAEASTFVHNEAKELSDLAAERLMARKANVIYDFTMSSQHAITTRVEPFVRAGYKAKAVFVDVSIEHARDAAEARHKRGFDKFKEGADAFGGRFVPGYAYDEATPPRGSTYRSTNRYYFEKWKQANPKIRTLTVDNDRYNTKIVQDRLAGRDAVQAVPHPLVHRTADQAGGERPVDLLAGAGLRPRIRIVTQRAAQVDDLDRLPVETGEQVDLPFGVAAGLVEHARHVGSPSLVHNTDRTFAATGADGTTTYTGAMVALAVPPGLALTGPGALSPGELHITLRYLGDSTGLSVTARARIVDLVDHAAGSTPPFRVRISGWGRLGDEGAVVVYVEAQELVGLHDRIAAAVLAAPDAHPGFTPHFTLGYGIDPDPDRLDGLIGTQFMVDRLLVWFGSTVSPGGFVMPGPGSAVRPLRAGSGTGQYHGTHNQKDHAGRWTMKDYKAGQDIGPPPWGSNKSMGVKAAKDAKAMVNQMAEEGTPFSSYAMQVAFDKKFGGAGAGSADAQAFSYYVNANAQRLQDVHYAAARLKDKTPEQRKLIESNSKLMIESLAQEGKPLNSVNLHAKARELGMDNDAVADTRSWFVQRASTTWVNYNDAKKAHAEKMGLGEKKPGDGTAGGPDLATKAKAAAIKAAEEDPGAATTHGGKKVIDVGSPKPKPKADFIKDMDDVDKLKAGGVNVDAYDLSDVKPHKPKVPDAMGEASAKATWQSLTPTQKAEAESYAKAAVDKLKADGKDVSIANIKEQFANYETSKVSQGVYALVSGQPSKYGMGGLDVDLGPATVKAAKAGASKTVKPPAPPTFDPAVVSGKNALDLPVIKGTKDAMKVTFPDVDYGEPGGKALEAYHGSSSSSINNPMRDGKPPDAKAVQITKLIHGKVVPEDVTVYRGMNGMTAAQVAKIKVGAVFTDHGFTSTDIHGQHGKSFSAGQVFMTIHVPAGTKAAYKHNHIGERELLIQRGTTYHVVGKITDPSTGKEAWHVEVLNQHMWKAGKFDETTVRLGETGVIDQFTAIRIITLHSAQRAVIMAGSVKIHAYARRTMRESSQEGEPVNPEFVLPTDPDPDNWGALDGPVDEFEHEDRLNDWTWDNLDVHFPGYDNQAEVDADTEDRARRLA